MQTELIEIIGFGLLALTFAILSLGHKVRLGQGSSMTINGIMSVIYEIVTVATIADILTTIFSK